MSLELITIRSKSRRSAVPELIQIVKVVNTRRYSLNILSIVLPITVVVSGIVIFATKGFEYLIYYVLLLGCFTLFTGLRGIRKKKMIFRNT